MWPHSRAPGRQAGRARTLILPLVLSVLAPLGCATAADQRALATLATLDPPAERDWPRPSRDRSDGPPETVADFGALVAAAARHSPALRAAWFDAQAAASDVTVAGRWPEPMVGLMAMVAADEAFVAEITARQAVPWPSKPGLTADVAAARVGVARREAERALRGLVRDLRIPWAALARNTEARALIEAQAAVVARLRSLVEARVAIGAAPYADLIRLGLREELLAERALSVADEFEGIAAQLRAVAGLPPDTPLPAPTLPDALPPTPSPEAILAALDQSPDVLVMEAARAAAEAAATRADASGLPDFVLGVGWSQMGGAMPDGRRPDMVSLMFEVKVPLWRGIYDAEADAARARVQAVSARREAVRQAAEGQLFAWTRSLERANRRAALFSGRLRESVESALTATLDAYGVGRASVLEVLALEDQLLAQSLDALEARADAARLAALLDYHLSGSAAPPLAAPTAPTPVSDSEAAPEPPTPEALPDAPSPLEVTP